jgi:hypothetical protein
MNEADVWQVIQTGNEISVLRIESFITITVGVLVISALKAIRLNLLLLLILLLMYLAYGYINFQMLIGEMYILRSGMEQLSQMVGSGQDVSLMGRWLASRFGKPFNNALIPGLQLTYWMVTISTMAYAAWCYRAQRLQ